jgi:hypothetical protein
MPCPFVWYELMTSDLPAATRFYASVAGWETADAGMPMPYVLASAGGRTLGGLMTLPAEAVANGAQPGWLGYIGVPDCDAAAARALAAGATQYHPPQDIPGIGRFATLADPQGAAFIVFQDRSTEPPALAPSEAPGQIGWNELITTDSAAAQAWYAEQFGWTAAEAIDMGEQGLYRMFATGGTPAGGMMDRPAEMPYSAWIFYVNVPALDAAIGRAEAGGGRVIFGPMQVPGGSWVANLTDPQGAVFALVAPAR